jgi:hypothetical protein
MSFLTLYGFGWNDYSVESEPAFAALVTGHIWRFLTLLPGYGGSLELRAPFALLGSIDGGGQDSVYRAASLPCLIVAALFALWLLGRMRALGHNRLARATALGLCVVNPVTYYALQDGHAEELLGAVLCVAAVLAAQRGRAGWTGLLLGLAIANKPLALLAVGPVLVALLQARVRALAIAGAVAAALYAPMLAATYLNHGSAIAALTTGDGSTIFQPWQLWWFLGSHGHVVRGSFGDIKVGYRTPPAWLVGSLPRLLIVALSVPFTALALRRRGTDAMLLLAFLLALRCALDSWDVVYYPLPFIFALLAWEVAHRRRPPALALTASVAVWLVFIVAPEQLSADAQALLFALVAVPTLVALALATYRVRIGAIAPSRGGRRRSSAPTPAPISSR